MLYEVTFKFLVMAADNIGIVLFYKKCVLKLSFHATVLHIIQNWIYRIFWGYCLTDILTLRIQNFNNLERVNMNMERMTTKTSAGQFPFISLSNL